MLSVVVPTYQSFEFREYSEFRDFYNIQTGLQSSYYLELQSFIDLPKTAISLSDIVN